MSEVPGSEKFIPADLVFLSLGFLAPQAQIHKKLGLTTDPRGNIASAPGGYMTSMDGVFAAGDCRRGQSLVVWGLAEGRSVAQNVDKYLMGSTHLPMPGGIPVREFLDPSITIPIKKSVAADPSSFSDTGSSDDSIGIDSVATEVLS
jgi:glutamate synthase (NADH)